MDEDLREVLERRQRVSEPSSGDCENKDLVQARWWAVFVTDTVRAVITQL